MPRFRRTILVLAFTSLAGCVRAAPSSGAPRDWAGGLPTKHVSFAILEDYDLGDDLHEVARDFALFRELGVRTWRGSISWLEAEPERGRYELDWLHRFARLAADSGITLRPYVAYTPEWAARGGTDSNAWNDPPRDIRDFADFARTLARAMRRHPNVRSFEIYNEENSAQWWDGPRAAYDSALALAAQAIRAEDPGVEVLLGGMVWPDASWTEDACRAARVNAVPFHAYPETWTPDSVTVESYLHDFGYASFLATERASCGGAPVWIDETGFATVPGKTEEDQARWWARAIATFLAERAVEEIGIYEIKDLHAGASAIGGEPNYHLGLTYADRRKKLAFSTVQMLVRLLDSGTLALADSALDVSVQSGTADGLRVHGFLRPDGGQVIIAWTSGEAVTIRLRLPIAGREASSYDLDGTAHGAGGLAGRKLELRVEPAAVRIVEVRP